MICFPTTLKPIYSNLKITKYKASFTYQTQGDDSLMKKEKKSELWVQVKNFPSISQQPHLTSINSTLKPIKNRIKIYLFDQRLNQSSEEELGQKLGYILGK